MLHVSEAMKPETKPTETMTNNQIRLTDLDFTVPPSCQGQAVTYSYAYDAEAASGGDTGCIVRRRSEHGVRDQYALFEDPRYEDEGSTNHEFWNGEPALGALLDEWTADGDSQNIERVTYRWDTTDPENAGWYAEALDAEGEVVTHSQIVTWPGDMSDLDSVCEDESEKVEEILREIAEFENAEIVAE